MRKKWFSCETVNTLLFPKKDSFQTTRKKIDRYGSIIAKLRLKYLYIFV